jgi:hypothetical protein
LRFIPLLAMGLVLVLVLVLVLMLMPLFAICALVLQQIGPNTRPGRRPRQTARLGVGFCGLLGALVAA